jgi:ABC-type polysaccharide/polyol phosphate export permease
MEQVDAVDVRTDRGGLWKNRFLVWNFARRDLKGRFKGTALGWAWSLLLPLATVLIYSVVFSLFIRIQPPPMGDGQPGAYWLWLLTGMVAWTFILNATTQGIPSLLANGSLLQKIYIPGFVPCLASTVAIAMQSLIEVAIVMAILLLMGNIGISWVLVPVWLLCLAAFVASSTYVLSVLNVYFRDVSQVVAVALQMVFFLTPIIYPITMIPESWNGIPVRDLIELSPFTEFVDFGHSLLYGLQVPSAWDFLAMFVWTALAILLATVVSRRSGQDVSEHI